MASEVVEVIRKSHADTIIVFCSQSGDIHPGSGSDLADEVPIIREATRSIGLTDDVVMSIPYNDVVVYAMNCGNILYGPSFSSEETMRMMVGALRQIIRERDLGKVLILDSDLFDTELMLEFRRSVESLTSDVAMYSRNRSRRDVMTGNYGATVAVVHPGHEYAEPFGDEFYERLIDAEAEHNRLYIRTNRAIHGLKEGTLVSSYSYRSGYTAITPMVVDVSVPETLVLYSSAGVLMDEVMKPFLQKAYGSSNVSMEVVAAVHSNALRGMLAACYGMFMNKPADIILMHKAFKRTIYEECLLIASEIATSSPYDAGKIVYVT